MSNAVNTPDADRNSNVDDRPGTRTDHLANDTTAAPDRTDVVGQQRELFGGMKFGSCFFGWLTASGTAVLLAALVTGIGAALGLSRNVGAAGTSPLKPSRSDSSAESSCWRSSLFPTWPVDTWLAGWPDSTESSRASVCGCGP